jgi:hypothetical protein
MLYDDIDNFIDASIFGSGSGNTDLTKSLTVTADISAGVPCYVNPANGNIEQSIQDKLPTEGLSYDTYYVTSIMPVCIDKAQRRYLLIYVPNGTSTIRMSIVSPGVNGRWKMTDKVLATTLIYGGYLSACLINTDKVLLAYGSGSALMTVVITTTNDVITIGTPVTTISYTPAGVYNMLKVSDDKAIFTMVYLSSSNYYETVVVITVSGTTPSLYKQQSWKNTTYSATVHTISELSNGDGTKYIIIYPNNSSSYYGAAIAFTLLGSTITFGSELIFDYNSNSYGCTGVAVNTNFALAFTCHQYNSVGYTYAYQIVCSGVALSASSTQGTTGTGISCQGFKHVHKVATDTVLIGIDVSSLSDYYTFRRNATNSNPPDLASAQYNFRISNWMPSGPVNTLIATGNNEFLIPSLPSGSSVYAYVEYKRFNENGTDIGTVIKSVQVAGMSMVAAALGTLGKILYKGVVKGLTKIVPGLTYYGSPDGYITTQNLGAQYKLGTAVSTDTFAIKKGFWERS